MLILNSKQMDQDMYTNIEEKCYFRNHNMHAQVIFISFNPIPIGGGGLAGLEDFIFLFNHFFDMKVNWTCFDF